MTPIASRAVLLRCCRRVGWSNQERSGGGGKEGKRGPQSINQPINQSHGRAIVCVCLRPLLAYMYLESDVNQRAVIEDGAVLMRKLLDAVFVFGACVCE